MKTLYLTRHGETLFNAQHRIQGWCDSPLTERGCAQARAMGALLRERGVRPDTYCSSTAERAADTLELMRAELEDGTLSAEQARAALAAARPVVVPEDDAAAGTNPERPCPRYKGLREMFYGNLEAQQDYLAENDPEACRTYYLPFGGESSDTVRDRMTATLAAIMRQPNADTVLAVGHGGANFNFLRGVLGLDDALTVLKGGWGNCATCVYTFDEAKADAAPNGSDAGPWNLVDVIRLP